MYRTKTNVFVHRTLLVLFFPSLFCQRSGFVPQRTVATVRSNIYPYSKTVKSVMTIFMKKNYFFKIKNCSRVGSDFAPLNEEGVPQNQNPRYAVFYG